MKYITVVRGKLKGTNAKEAQQVHDATIAMLSGANRPAGSVGHRPHLNPQNSMEFLAIDTWTDLEALQKFMSNPTIATEFGKLFEGMPDVSVWAESDWASF